MHGGSTHPSTKKENKTKEKHGGSVWLCVCGAAGVCRPSTHKNKKTRGKEMYAPPHRPSSAAPLHACSGRSAQGRRHERVGGCASGAVGRETHGTPHRKSAEETIKRGKRRKEKTVHIDCPKKRKKKNGWGMGDKKRKH
ncbi:hypothetical protein TcYC6_0036820 [Trypanosoma cruzi]|nr:hypothetical protein TcYC6_0036820 [Trypanosoma cruzi]